MSAFCAGTFADSQFSPGDNTESNDENLIRNQSTDRKFLGETASHRLEHKAHSGRQRKHTDSVLEDQKMIKAKGPKTQKAKLLTGGAETA